jgi:hypothetical protein
MIIRSSRIIQILFIIFSISLILHPAVYGQRNNSVRKSSISKKLNVKQDSIIEVKKQITYTVEPDTNFTWEKYASFLNKVSDTSKYIVLPLNEFRQTFNSNKIVIGLRHDVDNDLDIAYKFSEVEYKLGFRSTYFILHTAPYYLANPNNMEVHTDKIIPILKTMQDEKHFEIGWHNDLVTMQVVYNINPVVFLTQELNWLRSNGIRIEGTASHGSNYCKVYHYLNYYFFEECTYPVVPNYNNNITVPVGSKTITLIKGKLNDFGLKYEAYFLNNNKAFSDATITNGIRWNIGMLDLSQLQAGDRAVILLHPIHWHKASVFANIESFSLNGQKSVSIDSLNSVITVEMPYGTNLNSLIASYKLSPGAYAKVSGKMQVNKYTANDFNNPLTYTVYAENRDIIRNWTVRVHTVNNSACDFLTFTVPGLTKSVQINALRKTIMVDVDEHADLKHLQIQFDISAGATAWIGNTELFSNTGTFNFSGSTQIRVIAQDGVTSCIWTVIIQKARNLADFISFSVPGLIGKAHIDTLNNTVNAEYYTVEQTDSLKPIFIISPDAHAWIGNKEQKSDVNYIAVQNPVYYDIVSKDSLKIKKWKVSVLNTTLSAKEEAEKQTGLVIYPNPSDGDINLHFTGIKSSPTAVNIFNSMGEKVYSELVRKTGEFTFEANLKKLKGGVYIVKYSEEEKPEIIVIRKH